MSKKNGKKGFFAQFKEFIAKGNVLDMAVGVIIGNSFKAIVTALTDKIIMPAITFLLGDRSVEDFKTVLKPAVVNEAGEVVKEEAAIYWGAFIQALLDFLIVALVLFIILKVTMKLKEKREEFLEKVAKKHDEGEAEAAEAEAEAAKAEAEAAEAEAKEKEEACAELEKQNTELLKEIRDLLKTQKEQQ